MATSLQTSETHVSPTNQPGDVWGAGCFPLPYPTRFACCRPYAHAGKGEWYTHDDSRVLKTSASNAARERECYMLFYVAA